MEGADYIKELNRLRTIGNYLRAIKKRMPSIHRTVKGVGKVHQWRASELQELLDKFTQEVDKQVTEMENRLPKG